MPSLLAASLGSLLVPWERTALADWLNDNLPDLLVRAGPRGLHWWQWLAAPIVLAVAVVIGRTLSRVTQGLLRRAAERTRVSWDDAIVDNLRGPLGLAWGIAVAWLLVSWISLPPPAQYAIDNLLGSFLFVAFFWSLVRTVDVTAQIITDSAWGKANPSSRSLLAIGGRVAKVLILAMAVIAVVSSFGYPVASLIAGLGIGGLAVALAGQKTVENLFGAFSIGFDQPFREGDFIKFEDVVGTVEAIGLRSTRIRTLDRTIVTVPNGKIADTRTETFAVRDRFRLATIVGLEYGTTADQIVQVIAGIRGLLAAHPKIWPDAMTVVFRELGASSLNIEVMAWFNAADWNEFMAIRQDVLLALMRVVEDAGASFAFPTQTVHLVREPKRQQARPELPS